MRCDKFVKLEFWKIRLCFVDEITFSLLKKELKTSVPGGWQAVLTIRGPRNRQLTV
jgi:hypothetical protein